MSIRRWFRRGRRHNPGKAYCALHPVVQAVASPVLNEPNPDVIHAGDGVVLKPDTSSAGGEVTIDIDTLGPVPVRLADGVTDPTGAEIIAGRLYPIWYDGACFRLLIPPMNVGFAVASRPACDASRSGEALADVWRSGRQRRGCSLRERWCGGLRVASPLLMELRRSTWLKTLPLGRPQCCGVWCLWRCCHPLAMGSNRSGWLGFLGQHYHSGRCPLLDAGLDADRVSCPRLDTG